MTLHPDHMALLLKAVRKVPEADADAAWSHISARLRRCGDEPRAQDVKQIAGDVVRRFGASCWHHLSEPQQRGGEHRRLYPSGTSDVARAHAQPGAAVDPTAAPRQPLTGKTMTYTPFQWRNFHDRVLDLWRVFVASYGADTGAHTIGGGKWICADSGTAKEATEAERPYRWEGSRRDPLRAV